jgi:hypothetical protein
MHIELAVHKGRELYKNQKLMICLPPREVDCSWGCRSSRKCAAKSIWYKSPKHWVFACISMALSPYAAQSNLVFMSVSYDAYDLEFRV